MGRVKGQSDYKKFKEGKLLTRKHAIFAQCYICNGYKNSVIVCQDKSCPLYQHQPYRDKKQGGNYGFMGFQNKKRTDQMFNYGS